MIGHAPSISTKIASQLTSQDTSQDISTIRRRIRKNLLAIIIDALHHSRRLQARRTLRQYRHLIDHASAEILRALEAHCKDQHHVD